MSKYLLLPKKQVNRGFHVPLAYGINTGGSMNSSIVTPSHREGVKIIPTANLSKVHAKKIYSFNNNDYMMTSLNQWLSGGTSYPFLTTFLGIAVGAVNAPMGIAWSIFFTAMDSAKSNMSSQCFARVADQLWMLETVGIDNREKTHMRQIWLVDPLRNRNSGPPASSWCIAEDRTIIV
jgi:hypothetical protein